MRKLFSIPSFMIVGFFFQVGLGFACCDSKQAQAILERFQRFKDNPEDHSWKPVTPTIEDIQAANKVENLASKGSCEEKLIIAVKSGDFKNVEALISEGVSFEARDDENMTPLMIAASKGYVGIATKLINAGANINAKGRSGQTSFFYAVDKGHAEMVKVLIAHGALVNQIDFKGQFVSAAFKGDNEMVKALMAEAAFIDHESLEMAYSFARTRCSDEVANAIKELLKKSYS